jgi:Domain of unknown function (DUF4214)
MMTLEQTLPTTSKSGSPGADKPAIAARKLLHLEDFSCLANEPFIEAAYWVALHRGPDPEGKQGYLRLLENGTTKAEILAYLIDSPEGRSIGAKILGLAGAFRRARIHRYPGVGTLLRLGESLWPFTQDRRDIKAAFQRLAHLEDQAETRAKVADKALGNLGESLLILKQQIAVLETNLRKLLDGKADATAIPALEASIEKRWNTRFDALTLLFETLSARQMDLAARQMDLAARQIDATEIESVKKGLHASLQAALGGLTQSVTAVAASRVDRETIEALLAEASKAVVEQLHEEIRELKSSLQQERQTGRKV